MTELRLAITVGQRRGLRSAVITITLAALVLGVLRLQIAVALGIAALVVLWSYVMYARAFTECTSNGIRTRGLGGLRQCAWAQIAAIDIRPGPRSRLVVVTTTHGTRFWLGAPVDGGVMRDQEFDAKFWQILDYWQAARATSSERKPA